MSTRDWDDGEWRHGENVGVHSNVKGIYMYIYMIIKNYFKKLEIKETFN